MEVLQYSCCMVSVFSCFNYGFAGGVKRVYELYMLFWGGRVGVWGWAGGGVAWDGVRRRRANSGTCLFSVIVITMLNNLLFNCSATIVSNTRGNLRTFFGNTNSFRCASIVRKFASSDTLVNYVVNDSLSNLFTDELNHGHSLVFTNIYFFLST